MLRLELSTPVTLQEAMQLLSSAPDMVPIAGGTDLLTCFHKETHIESLKVQPAPTQAMAKLVDISSLKELQGIEVKGDVIDIGAGTTHDELSTNQHIRTHCPALAEAALRIGSPQIRNRGTLGGNIVHASPSADTVPALLVMNAELQLISSQSFRRYPLCNFFRGPGETILQPGEIITRVFVPIPRLNTIQFYRRIAARKVHACAKASVAMVAINTRGVLTQVRIAFGAVAPTVIQGNKTAQIIEGQRLSQAIINSAVEMSMSEVQPIDDIRSTAEYRRAMIGELLRQGLSEVLQRNRVSMKNSRCV